MDRHVPGWTIVGSPEVASTFRSRSVATGTGKSTTVKEFVKGLSDDQGALVLILDGITDPQNLGAILRSADQFSVDLVIMPDRRSAQANETVNRISSGAAQYVPMSVVTNLVREMEILQEHGFWVYGADMAVTTCIRLFFHIVLPS